MSLRNKWQALNLIPQVVNMSNVNQPTDLEQLWIRRWLRANGAPPKLYASQGSQAEGWKDDWWPGRYQLNDFKGSKPWFQFRDMQWNNYCHDPLKKSSHNYSLFWSISILPWSIKETVASLTKIVNSVYIILSMCISSPFSPGTHLISIFCWRHVDPTGWENMRGVLWRVQLWNKY
jgi:hypothetical protein